MDDEFTGEDIPVEEGVILGDAENAPDDAYEELETVDPVTEDDELEETDGGEQPVDPEVINENIATLDTTVNVVSGDRVIITLIDGEPIVTGVVGGGDNMAADVNSALTSAEIAEQAANSAQASARSAANGLSEVEKVIGTLQWIAEHGTYVNQTGQTFDPTKIYYTRSGTAPDYTYTIVDNPVAADIASYYVLVVNESVQNYIASHVYLLNDGLYVTTDSNDYKVRIDGDSVDIINPVGNVVSSFGSTVVLGNPEGYNAVIDQSGIAFEEIDMPFASMGDFGMLLQNVFRIQSMNDDSELGTAPPQEDIIGNGKIQFQNWYGETLGEIAESCDTSGNRKLTFAVHGMTESDVSTENSFSIGVYYDPVASPCFYEVSDQEAFRRDLNIIGCHNQSLANALLSNPTGSSQIWELRATGTNSNNTTAGMHRVGLIVQNASLGAYDYTSGSTLWTFEGAKSTVTTVSYIFSSITSGITITSATFTSRNRVAQLTFIARGFSGTGAKTIGTLNAAYRPASDVVGGTTARYVSHTEITSAGACSCYWETATSSTANAFTFSYTYLL